MPKSEMKAGNITTDFTETKKIIRECYGQLRAGMLDGLDGEG